MPSMLERHSAKITGTGIASRKADYPKKKKRCCRSSIGGGSLNPSSLTSPIYRTRHLNAYLQQQSYLSYCAVTEYAILTYALTSRRTILGLTAPGGLGDGTLILCRAHTCLSGKSGVQIPLTLSGLPNPLSRDQQMLVTMHCPYVEQW